MQRSIPSLPARWPRATTVARALLLTLLAALPALAQPSISSFSSASGSLKATPSTAVSTKTATSPTTTCAC